MIHLDTNLLIELVTVGSPHVADIHRWLLEGQKLGASAIVWSQFCNGPHTREQKDGVFAILSRRVFDFTWQQAEQASLLFHRTGRRRGSFADCMIAASAMAMRVPIATRNTDDFRRFVPYGLLVTPVK